MPLSSLLPKTKTHKDKATQTHPNARSNTRGHRHGHRARARALARALAEEAAVGRPSVAGHGAEGRRVRGDDKRRRRKQRRQGGMRAPCSGRRTPDRSPAAALRARINERQDETREMTRRRGCGCLRGRTSRGSRGFSDRGGAAALRKRADRRATGRGGKARLPGGAALKSAMFPGSDVSSRVQLTRKKRPTSNSSSSSSSGTRTHPNSNSNSTSANRTNSNSHELELEKLEEKCW